MGFLKIDGMTSSATAENNCLKDIIGEVVEYYSDTPDETFTRPQFEIMVYGNWIRIYESDTDKTVCEYGNLHYEISDEKIDVFYKKYSCSLSGDIKYRDLINVYFRDALDEYTISGNTCDKHYCKNQYHSRKYTQVPMIELRVDLPDSDCTSRIQFAFNIEDVRKKPLLAFFMMLNRKRTLNQPSLPLEVLKTNVLSYFDTIEEDGTYVLNKSPDYLKCAGDYKISAFYSKAQIKKLYELGIIKIANIFRGSSKEMEDKMLLDDGYDELGYIHHHFWNHYYDTRIMSDESFDADNKDVLKSEFQTKEKMHECIQVIIQAL